MRPTRQTQPRLFHGGVPDLRAGDLIQPGSERRFHEGCEFCEARARGEAHNGIDGPSLRPDRVYATTSRLYAKHYASLYGRGDLYRVALVGEIEPSIEDTIESFTGATALVLAVLDRAVLLTNSERNRLEREWEAADRAFAARREG